jgi:hypothetical protein
MAARSAGANTDKSRSQYVNFLLTPQDGSIFATLYFSCSFDASRRAGSRGMLQSARFLGLARDFDRALIRKIT